MHCINYRVLPWVKVFNRNKLANLYFFCDSTYLRHFLEKYLNSIQVS